MKLDDEYVDYLKLRKMLVEIGTELVKAEKQLSEKTKVKTKQKPTINHWKATGSQSVILWLFKEYPLLKKIGMNPKVYKDSKLTK